MTVFESGSEFDRADQRVPVHDEDAAGLDTEGLSPAAEFARSVIDTAEVADRLDQAWIVTLPVDDLPGGVTSAWLARPHSLGSRRIPDDRAPKPGTTLTST